MKVYPTRSKAMPMERVRTAEAISKPEFHTRLRAWVHNTEDSAVGPPDVPGVTPWVYVTDGRARYEFHADVQRDAVEGYLRLVDLHGDDLEWTVVENQRGRPNAVAYGPRQERVTPFYLYLT
jgi:hypothetical protein